MSTDSSSIRGSLRASARMGPLRIFDVLIIIVVGPDLEPSLLHSLPNRAMPRLIQHVVDLSSGFFDDEILCGLNVSGPKYDADEFIDSERVKMRFYIFFSDRVLLIMAEMHDGYACIVIIIGGDGAVWGAWAGRGYLLRINVGTYRVAIRGMRGRCC